MCRPCGPVAGIDANGNFIAGANELETTTQPGHSIQRPPPPSKRDGPPPGPEPKRRMFFAAMAAAFLERSSWGRRHTTTD